MSGALPEIGVAPHPGDRDRDRDLVTHRALQDLVAILCGPNHVIPMVKCAMACCRIAHEGTPGFLS